MFKRLTFHWNKTFKANCTGKCNDWLAKERIINETEVSKLKAPPRKVVIKCILDVWAVFTSEMIRVVLYNVL